MLAAVLSAAMSILDEIFAHKRVEVAAARECVAISDLEAAIKESLAPPDFAAALKGAPDSIPRLIAEVKYRSPSKGILCPDFDHLRLARTYAENGAAAISVLTDEKYFGGSLDYLQEISDLNLESIKAPVECYSERIETSAGPRYGLQPTRPAAEFPDKHLSVPLLRKDFIFDHYQLLEARAAGASAILLIVAMLEPTQLRDLLAAAREMDLEALVETHTSGEVEQALEAGACVIGVNNRDLHTFNVSLETSLQLRPQIPSEVVMVAESGIHTTDDIARLAAAGVDAMLIGEGLVTAPDVGIKVRMLTSN
jgi:indole-3-glycerol phosphate synthase